MKLLHFDTLQIFSLIASLRTFPITCCCSVRRAHEELPCEGPHHQDSDLQGLVISHPMPVTTAETHQASLDRMSEEMPSWCRINGSAAMPARLDATRKVQNVIKFFPTFSNNSWRPFSRNHNQCTMPMQSSRHNERSDTHRALRWSDLNKYLFMTTQVVKKINCKLFIGLAMAMTLHDFVIILFNFAPPY